MLDMADRENFMHTKSTATWQVATDPEEALKLIFSQQQSGLQADSNH
jgi:hypothetical protein